MSDTRNKNKPKEKKKKKASLATAGLCKKTECGRKEIFMCEDNWTSTETVFL